MTLALLLLLHVALALPALSVPAGPGTVTVLLCDAQDGCPREARALDARTQALGLAMLDFDVLALEGPGGHAAAERWDEAWAQLVRRPDLERARRAREALADLPFTVPAEQLLELQLAVGEQLLRAGAEAEGLAALEAAASCTGGRVHDLPAMSPLVEARYFDVAEAVALGSRRPGYLVVDASGGGRVFIDGHAVGAAPLEVASVPGWHRVSVESSGARTAWVGEVMLPPGQRLLLHADTTPSGGTGALETALLGATRGQLPGAVTTEALLSWARAEQLQWVRFVALFPAEGFPDTALEVIPDVDPEHAGWAVRDTWLDVEAGRFVARDAGLAALVDEARPMRFRAGLGLGYSYLALRPGLSLDLNVLLRLRRLLALDLRVGLLRSPEPVYLYPGWSEHSLLPVAAGVRLGPDEPGPYASLQALAVVPWALGGVARVGWELAPATYWRVGIEAGVGLTDEGWLAVGGLQLVRRY